ncbi:DUF1711-domain-containing protein [Thozetella sp. PMI_491]|nr:DUF1711-domain-containing protein [Thozetella sp. PMI_491]
MAPASKNAAAAKDRRKSTNATTTTTTTTTTAAAALRDDSPSKESHIITLTVSSEKLRRIIDPDSVDDESPLKDAKASPATSATLPAATNSNAENASDSTPNTPAPGTPAPQSSAMGPPTEGPKKRGIKRGVAGVNGEPKPRGKPGPKKKQRLDDGTLEGGRSSLGVHKLGPKANQGAINAGLRALDRSGKPCRKWNRGGFTLKSFTGVTWEINRWTAPPKPRPEESNPDDSTPASAEGSSKENKENNSQVKSENSNNENSNNGGGDVEMQSGAPSLAAANSPAPVSTPVLVEAAS